jgi:hypothetical protein
LDKLFQLQELRALLPLFFPRCPAVPKRESTSKHDAISLRGVLQL